MSDSTDRNEAAAQAPSAGATLQVIDIARILQLIPHRYPFLLIDKVVDVVLGEQAVGIKNVTINENFFPGQIGRAHV